MTQSLKVIEVDSSGASLTINPANLLVPQIVWLTPLGGSPISFAAPWAIQFTTDPDMGNQTIFRWKGGDFDLNGQTFTIQGISITQEQLNTNGQLDIITVDTSGTNNIVYTANISDDESIPGTALVIDSVPLNRLTGMTSAQIVLADSSNVPTATTVSGDATIDDSGVVTIANEAVTNAKLADLASGFIKVGNGSNRPADVQMTGDVTMTNAGVTTIADGAVTPEKLSFSTGLLAVQNITLSSAEILALNSTPKLIIPAPGVGNAIIIQNAVLECTYVSAAYATNTNVLIYTDTATLPQAGGDVLDFSGSRAVKLDQYTNVWGAADTQVISNKGLYITVSGGNPTAGDGTAVLTVWYLILPTNA